jgi:hypothetical protein
MAITPPNNQQRSTHPGLGRLAARSPDVVKIPVPIILATTMAVAENAPNFLSSNSIMFSFFPREIYKERALYHPSRNISFDISPA